MFDQNLNEFASKRTNAKDVADFCISVRNPYPSGKRRGYAFHRVSSVIIAAFNCKIDDFFASHKSVPIELDHLQKFSKFCKLFELEKDDPEYIPPD